MSGPALTLGPVGFAGFEVPERIAFGGKQRLAIHRLPGGGRVIDAMGRDDGEICWSGIFAGADAADRARLLDLLRVGGAALPLLWDGFFYTVVIARFDAEYRNPFWLPYRIACAVVRDEAQAEAQVIGGLAADALADLAKAAGLGADVASAQAALRVAGSAVLGGATYAQTQVTVAVSLAAIAGGIDQASLELGSDDFPASIAAAETLANQSAARGFVARVGQNLAGASS